MESDDIDVINDELENRTLKVFYDLQEYPTTFDCLQFFASANIVRQFYSLKYMQINIVLGSGRQFRRLSRKDATLSYADKFWRLHKIVESSARLVKNCAGVNVFHNRNDAERFWQTIQAPRLFPPDYTVQKPNYSFILTLSTLKARSVFMENRNGKEPDMGVFEPSEAALAAFDDWKAFKKIDKPIVSMTLRTSRHEQERNANILQWRDFANYARERGFVPVGIPDTEVALSIDVGDLPKDLYWYPMAALDPDLRAALYRRSFISMSTGGGPAHLLPYMNDTNYMIFMHPNRFFASVQNEEQWKGTMGIDWLGQFPWSTPTQQFVWKEDTFENIRNSFEDMLKLFPAENRPA